MSGHETIRVLEVEVDGSLPSLVPDGKTEGKAEEATARCAVEAEATRTQNSPKGPHSSMEAGKSGFHQFQICVVLIISDNSNIGWLCFAVIGEQQVASADASAPAVQTVNSAPPLSVSLPQPQASMPITVQGCPQVISVTMQASHYVYIVFFYLRFLPKDHFCNGELTNVAATKFKHKIQIKYEIVQKTHAQKHLHTISLDPRVLANGY